MRTSPHSSPRRTRWWIAAVGMLAAALVGTSGVPAQAAPATTAATTCSSVWYRFEVGNNGGHFVKPRSSGQNASLYGTGTEAEDWNNWFQLCRDPGWAPGDYALRANLGGYYARVSPSTWDVIMASPTIVDTTNLIRIRNFDGNFQTLWSPYTGRYVGPVAPAGQLQASTASLNGTNLYKVRSKTSSPAPPPSMPCDPAGPLC